jgi:hypothetical protein
MPLSFPPHLTHLQPITTHSSAQRSRLSTRQSTPAPPWQGTTAPASLHGWAPTRPRLPNTTDATGVTGTSGCRRLARGYCRYTIHVSWACCYVQYVLVGPTRGWQWSCEEPRERAYEYGRCAGWKVRGAGRKVSGVDASVVNEGARLRQRLPLAGNHSQRHPITVETKRHCLRRAATRRRVGGGAI